MNASCFNDGLDFVLLKHIEHSEIQYLDIILYTICGLFKKKIKQYSDLNCQKCCHFRSIFVRLNRDGVQAFHGWLVVAG